jgi:hypothetical protein
VFRETGLMTGEDEIAMLLSVDAAKRPSLPLALGPRNASLVAPLDL